jgi:predicted Zn-dependent protease
MRFLRCASVPLWPLISVCSVSLWLSEASAAQQPPPSNAALIRKSVLGKEAIEAQRYDEAISIYTELVKALPKNPGIRFNLGMAYALSGRPREAIPHLERAVALQPSLMPAWMFMGSAYLDAGEPAKAVPALQKVAAADPKNIEARQMLGEALLSAGRYADAVRHMQRLTTDRPKDPAAWYGLGRAYEGQARQAFEQLQKTAPQSAYTQLLVADVLMTQERYPRAFTLYREALKALPGFGPAHQAVAEIYAKTGKEDWAKQERTKAPSCAGAQGAGIECVYSEGRFGDVAAIAKELRGAEGLYWRTRAFNELATRAFTTLESLPSSLQVHVLRAEILTGQGRFADAAAALREAQTLEPENPLVRRELALALYLAREDGSARRALEQAVVTVPDDVDVLYAYGDLLLRAQQPDQALRPLTRAVQLRPARMDARAALGRALLQLGHAGEALPHLEAALPSDEDGSLHFQLARAYQDAGQPDRAKPLLEKSQALRQAAEGGELEAPPAITPP